MKTGHGPTVREASIGHRRGKGSSGAYVELRRYADSPREIRKLHRECTALLARIDRAKKVLTLLKRERRRNEGPVMERTVGASLTRRSPAVGRTTEQTLREAAKTAGSPAPAHTPPGGPLHTPTLRGPGEGELPSTGH